jgi:hypothetical protein
MITVSGFQENILESAQSRLSTVSIGAAVCVIVSIVIFPVWAGEDLHNLIALNIEKLGNSLEGMYVPNLFFFIINVSIRTSLCSHGP